MNLVLIMTVVFPAGQGGRRVAHRVIVNLFRYPVGLYTENVMQVEPHTRVAMVPPLVQREVVVQEVVSVKRPQPLLPARLLEWRRGQERALEFVVWRRGRGEEGRVRPRVVTVKEKRMVRL